MSIKNIKPNKGSKFKQGYYNPKNPEKYLGDPGQIIFRSSYEERFCNYCDSHPSIVYWSSEPFEIPYFSPIDQKTHKYYVDFYMKVQKSDDEFEEFLIEIKPEKQVQKPILEGERQTLKKMKNYNYMLKNYILNKAKWKAAKVFSESRGYQFKIITEKFLFNSGKNR